VDSPALTEGGIVVKQVQERAEHSWPDESAHDRYPTAPPDFKSERRRGLRDGGGNLMLLTSQLNQPGALGEWLPTNINQKLDAVLGGGHRMTTANSTLTNANAISPCWCRI
jgi:hypothetical protein